MQRGVEVAVLPARAGSARRAIPGSLVRRWFVFGLTFMLLLVGLPWLAPVFMRLGWDDAGRAIYGIYSFLCHQLPQRSFFLFGERLSYSLAEIRAAWPDASDLWSLRQVIGNPAMGYKVAWSDRMVSLYTSIPLAALLWWGMRNRIRALPLWGLVLMSLPIMVDGASHTVSDLAGIGQGFRDSNAWLAALTSNAFPASFYAGDAWGSFNAWMRLITGLLFGVGVVAAVFPRIYAGFGPAQPTSEVR